MRLRVMSDLHLEFGALELPRVEADVTILAGDIAVGLGGLEWAAERLDGPLIYVPGNHEFYGQSAPEHRIDLDQAAAELGIHLLGEDTVVLDGVRFLGTTLWTDFDLHGTAVEAQSVAAAAMADYRRIRIHDQRREIRPNDTVSWYRRGRRWLEAELARPWGGPTVVVTPHAPSARSLASTFADHPLAAAYASQLDELVARSGAALWIHGHTHVCLDYTIGDTRVIANQRGYVDDPVRGFDPARLYSL